MDVLLHFQIKKQEEKRNWQLKKVIGLREHASVCLSTMREMARIRKTFAYL